MASSTIGMGPPVVVPGDGCLWAGTGALNQTMKAYDDLLKMPERLVNMYVGASLYNA